jgi:arylsulfatase A-like enzyme
MIHLNRLLPAFLCSLCCLLGHLHAAENERPNILVIMLDDAGYNDFGFMGSEDIPTPHIDRLAASGVVFTDFHVSASVCSPSRAGFLTGRYQQRFGHEANVPPVGMGMDPTEQTIGDYLQAAGYRTSIVGKWHVGDMEEHHPNNRGFDEFYGLLEGWRHYFWSPDISDKPDSYHKIERNGSQVRFDGYLSDVLTDEAIATIDSFKEDDFFLFLSYTAPHTPMEAKEEDLERFEGHPRQTYAAMMYNVDMNIGRVLDKLEAEGLIENTLIFFLSDNGGAGNNQSSNFPLKSGKGNKYEGGIRVPFIAAWPEAFAGGGRVDGLTSALDVLPTILNAAHIEQKPLMALDGVNLLPYLKGQTSEPPHQVLFWRKLDATGMRMNQYKLIRVIDYGYRLYDLEANIGETDDLVALRPDLFKAMKATLEQWERGLMQPLWGEGKWEPLVRESHIRLMENRDAPFKSPE